MLAEALEGVYFLRRVIRLAPAVSTRTLPSMPILAGSGVGIRIWLVTILMADPWLMATVISWEREYGAERDVMISVTVLCAEPAPEKLSGPLDSSGDPAPLQKGSVGGANRSEVSTQLIRPTLPAPVTEVMERLLV